ncbi:hypothetical protein FJU30_06315 [Affinibrenneria salicis]|uniref:SrfA n=1 Tax=Affinibrenneria salicis TaxID=2590031 RepID=A0A5J5G4V7_9GAMM|nr:SrfA family protein [Affinibrenneria salicis]KAA9001894.1 hypothetical protein FJU30_06315 [Affinibrenneria salicis]
MAKSFLRSGSLDDFLALGENGQPVYASALQLRETLRLRKQLSIADCLAIPQSNEHGDRIDWYAPVDGKVTSWLAASDEQRLSALARLENCQADVADISRQALNSDKAARKLFGALLSKAFQFPGANHVYLVGDQPVITFWGFVNLDKKSRADALECLRPVMRIPEPEIISQPAPPLASPEETPAPVAAADLPPVIEPTPAEAPPPAAPARRAPRWWLVPAAALLVILGIQIAGMVNDHRQRAVSAPAVVSAEKTAPAAEQPLPPPAMPAQLIALAEAPLPLELATPLPPPPPAEPVAVATEESSSSIAPGSELVLHAESVKVGSVSFLNGKWRAVINIKTPLTGRPPSLLYQLKDGAGTVKLVHGDGVTCEANISAGLMKSGNLVINSRYKARCSDGSRYQLPAIACKQGLTGAAECNGRYDARTTFPMTIKRESE